MPSLSCNNTTTFYSRARSYTLKFSSCVDVLVSEGCVSISSKKEVKLSHPSE